MRKIIKRVGALLASAVMLVGSSLAVCASDNGSYSFNYDYWGDVQDSPDAYTVQEV